MKLKIDIQKGFTLPEVAVSMTIMSIVFLSVLYITGEASYFFNREIMREEIQHYGNTILDDLSDQITTAPEIKLSYTSNSRKIVCEFDSVSYVYTADPFLGILKDGKPLEILRFNKSKKIPYQLELMEFDCTPEFAVSERVDRELRNSVYNIELVIDALFNKDNKEIRQRFEFTRKVFARSRYANT